MGSRSIVHSCIEVKYSMNLSNGQINRLSPLYLASNAFVQEHKDDRLIWVVQPVSQKP